ncbi:MAG TPA: hypothetical protein VMO26_15540 [Vicinamibacterales bacterium]|nr:hypothetical protein [Vicinamibacterales bacterium]
MPRTHVGTVCLLAGLLVVATAAPFARHRAVRQDDQDHAAYKHLNEEIARYLAIHTGLRAEVPGRAPNSSARELSAASDTLANAIRRARPRGRQGDFFDADATRLITERLRNALRSPNLAAALAGIDDERPATLRPQPYLRFPAANEMATMPPSLLRLLPRLPAELEYRIAGEYLVLRDVKAAMILDYIPDAVPRR